MNANKRRLDKLNEQNFTRVPAGNRGGPSEEKHGINSKVVSSGNDHVEVDGEGGSYAPAAVAEEDALPKPWQERALLIE